MNMAEGAPPNKRPKTDGDVFKFLEDSLPDELMSGNAGVAANSGFQLNTSQSTSQSAQMPIASVLSPVTNPPHSTIQNHKKLSQLLHSGTNSPKHSQTLSPNNTNSPRPQQQHTPHPQPSPLSTAQNSMQSPNAGQMTAIRNSLKSPPSSLPRPNSRPNSALRATPSPRSVPMSVGTIGVGGMGTTSLASSVNNPMRYSMGSGMNSHPMPSSGGSNQDKLNMANGVNRLNSGMGGDLQGNLNMQMGQMMNQQTGNFIGQSRMQSQVGGPMHTMGLSNFGQQPHVNMPTASRPVSVKPGSFNGPSMARPPGMMPPVGNIQNHPGDVLSMDGPMMLGDKSSDNMQIMQPQSSMNIAGGNVQMQQIRPNMPMIQSGNMHHHLNPQVQDIAGVMMPPETGQQALQRTLNHSVMNSLPQGASQDQMMNMSARSQTGMASGSSGNTPADPEKRRLIQQQLVLLLHAYKCSKKEHSGNPTNCTLPHCKTMKDVLNHMNVCTQGKSCQVAHCASSRQIIAHWRACSRQDCVVCLPLKSVPNNNASGASVPMRWPTPVSQMGDSSMAISSATSNHVPSSSSAPPYPSNFNADAMLNHNAVPQSGLSISRGLGNLSNGIPAGQPGMGRVDLISETGQIFFHQPRIEREWHKDVKEELRNHLVQKLVQAIFPTPQKVSLTDERMKKLLSFAKKVEGDMYEQANSRSEYYHLLAEKIYKIQKELEEKRALRMRRVVPMGPRMPAPNGPVQVNPIGSMVPGVGGGMRMTSTPMTASRMSGVPVRMHQSMASTSTVQNSSLPNVSMNQNPQLDFNDPMMLQFQRARDKISQQNPSISNTQLSAQTNLIQNSNNMGSNNSFMCDSLGDVFGSQIDVKSTMGQGDNISHGASAKGPVNQVLQGAPISNTGFYTRVSVQSAQPRLEKLLKETDSTSSTSGLGTNSSFYGSDAQSTTQTLQQQQQRVPFGSSQPSLQKPASLQDLLQGPSSISASSPSTKAGSFVSFPPTSSSTSSNVLTSPPPFVNTQAVSDTKEGILPSSVSETFSTLSSGIVKTEINSESATIIKIEQSNDSNSGLGSKGKNWSPSVGSSVKSEVKLETEESFSTMSPAVSSVPPTTNHDPFVKQESMSAGESTGAPKPKVPWKVFEPLELKVALLPVVEKLYKQEPEALPFRQPVDPEKLSIPDYFEIVKEPMDLTSIRKNLETGKYKEPWEFISDVWKMFNNAWLYNRRTTRVYKYCSKLKEIFEVEIDPVMQRLGYCCGRKMEFMPMTLCCYGKQLCTIPTGAVYYDYQSRYDYCEKCFNDISGDAISLADDPSKPQSSVTTIPKIQFERKKNDVHDPEPSEICNGCGREMHKICVLHMSPIWPEGFTCDECLSKRGTQRKSNRYNALKLPQNKLGEYIEHRVNSYIKRHDTTGDAGHVRIRVVYSGDKTVEVRSGMKSRFVDTKEMPETFPYRAKAFFAFEEIDGVDVCFFGVHVQEYGSDAPQPNQRRVYLSYLDSVHFFRPRHLRTAVYHEILIGYFEYCKNLGYEFAHIWACPPCEGDDYIFHCHPPEQKIPKPKRLQDWYKKMLDKAISEQVIVDYKDIFHQAKEDRLQSARELPYFEGDFWPNVLEESIKEIEQEEEDRKQAEANEQAAAEESDQGPSGGLKNGTQSKKSKKATIKKTSQRTAKKKAPQSMNDLSDKLYQIMEKHKEVFFVIRLNSIETISKMGPTIDPDPTLQCDLMDGRDAFLTLAREKHYEFSSLRRAKWSSMTMLVELHTNGQDKFSYMCNNCKNNVETRYQCTVCHDFDLCITCHKKVGHTHKMVKVGFGLDVGSPGPGSSNAKSSQIPVERCMQSLVHASQCRNANCNMPACFKMKKVVHHAKNCKKISTNTCPICRQFIALCYYHAKHCQEKKCPVAFCYNIKAKMKEQDRQNRMRNAHLMRRRMKVMSQKSAQQSGPHTPAGVANANMPNQSSPKIDCGGMRKPQPSPMNTSQDIAHPMGQKSQGGMMISPQQADGNNMGSGTSIMSQSQIASPQMSMNQMGNPVGMISSTQTQQPGVMLNSGQQPNFIRHQTYQSPPPVGAIRAAQQARQVADRQAREKLNQFITAPIQNKTVVNTRPILQSSMPRVMGPNATTGGWARQPVRAVMPGQLGPAASGTPLPLQQTVNTGNQPGANNNQALKQVIDLLKRNDNPGGAKERNTQQLMMLLKNNPQLINTIIRQRKQSVQSKAVQQSMQHKQFMLPNTIQTPMANMQQQQTMVGMQQGNCSMPNTMNQAGMSMQPGQVSSMSPQMQWQQQQQQQQQQQHRLQSQHQQGPFQTPAPSYNQTLNQQRMMNVRFQQRMPGQIRHQQMNAQMVMQQGMSQQISGMQQGLQSSIAHHPVMAASKGVVAATRPPSQPMQVGRPGMQQHSMAGRTTPLNQNQAVVQQHMVSGLDQQPYNVASSQPTLMAGVSFNQGTVFNAGGGSFPNQVGVNQSLGHMGTQNPNQANLDSYVKISDK